MADSPAKARSASRISYGRSKRPLNRPKRGRRSHFRVGRLSADAQRIVRQGFIQDRTLDAIIAEIREATGEVIARSSLGRYRRHWHATERLIVQAHEKAEELMRAYREYANDDLAKVLEDTIAALTVNALLDAKQLDPMELLSLWLERERASSARLVEIERRRAAALEAQVKELTEAARSGNKMQGAADFGGRDAGAA